MALFNVRLLPEAVEFLRFLPSKLRAKTFRTIELLREFGPDLPMPHSRMLKAAEGLRELRVKQASNVVRLFYFRHGRRIYVVTSGLVKKSGRTDRSALERAIRLMHAFKEQSDEKPQA